MFECRDCGLLSSSKICDVCKANRNTCANGKCTKTVPPNGKFQFCMFCACSNKTCLNAKEPGHNICRECLDVWVRKPCYICETVEANPPFNTCQPCNQLRKECIRCEKKQVFVHGSKNPPKFYKYCPEHKCKTQNCGEQRLSQKEICEKCATKELKNLCLNCKQHPSLKDGSKLCYLCNRDRSNLEQKMIVPPTQLQMITLPLPTPVIVKQFITPTCKQPGCTEKVKYSVRMNRYYDVCYKCTCQNPFCDKIGRLDLSGFCGAPCLRCNANGCNRVANSKYGSEWCAKCYTMFEQHGQVLCTNCPNYTKNSDGTCDACLKPNITVISMTSTTKLTTTNKPLTSRSTSESKEEWGKSDSDCEENESS